MAAEITASLTTKALTKAFSEPAGAQKPAGQSFQEVMNSVGKGWEFADMLDMTGKDMSPAAKMEVLSGEGISPVESELTSATKGDAQQKVVDMLGEVNKGQMQMDSLVNEILYSGKKFSNQELLVIQAHVFHFAQMTELTVKLAEHSVSSAKSVLNTQVQ